MASKVSSGQSEIYRTRMLPVVSSSAHNSLPRDGRKDAQKARSSDISGRKNQAHGFKPLFPIDTSNFVSKIVDRNTHDSSEARDPKPRLITPLSSSIARPSPYPKDFQKDVKKEEELEAPPRVPPRKTLPHNPPSTKSEHASSHQLVRTERRSLPSPRTVKTQQQSQQSSRIPSTVSTSNDRTHAQRSSRIVRTQSEQSNRTQSEQSNKSQNQQSNRSQSEQSKNRTGKSQVEQSSGSVRTLPVSEGTDRKPIQTSVVNEAKQIKFEKSECTQTFSSGIKFSSQTTGSDYAHVQRNVDNDSKPLTRTNVTQHDKIWVKDEPKNETGKLIPPLQDITPETTEELWNNFDPLDILDSGSESSADTMIMMTTEEEQRNDEKIQQNQKQYESVKISSNRDVTPTRETGSDIDLHNGDSVYEKHSKDLDLSPKSSEEDDGYGTNSSTSTNFSSSLSSLGNGDLEQKPLHGILKKTGTSVTTGGTSVTTGINGSSNSRTYSSQNGQSHNTWAVRRRTKMTESQDNSLQEKLRQLAIIEEENTHEESQDDRLRVVRRNSDASNTGSFGYSSDNDSHWKSVVNSAPSRDDSRMTRRVRPSEEEEKQEEVIQNDLKKFEGELYDKLTDMDLNYRNYYGFDNGQSNEKDDSKVLYFQQKMIKQQYGNDNYYNPSSYQSASQGHEADYSSSRAHTLPTQTHNMAKNMTSMPDLCRRAYAQDSRHVQNYGIPNGYESQNASYRSLASNNSGNYSTQDYINASNDNISVHSGYSMPGSLYKTKYVSVDNINQNGKRTAFASSADIYNLFQSKENLATQLQRPASYRHSFHAVPVSVAAGKVDPNYDIFNEKDEPRPRSSSTSVGSKSKSWNPFGSLFSKKRSKSSQSGENLSKTSEKSTKSGTGSQVKGNGPVISQPRIKTPEILPRQQLIEENGPVTQPIIKSSTLPRHTSSDKMFPDKPFKTIALFEESGTKLSTLV